MSAPENVPGGEIRSVCKSCFETTIPEDRFCQHCGFPLQGTEEQQSNFIYHRGYKKLQVKELNEKASYASITFYVIAGVLLLSGLLSFAFNVQNNDSAGELIIYGILSISFLLLGVWSNKKPVAAIICGLSLYIIFILLQAMVAVSGIFSGIILKVLVIAGLIRALVAALEAEEIKKQHNI
jgi:hypothetical protein